MRRKPSGLLWILSGLLFLLSDVWAWLEPTHEILSEYSALHSVIGKTGYLKDLGLETGLGQVLALNDKEELTVTRWIKRGEVRQDSGWYKRSTNHFHNPLKAWSEAGLNDMSMTGKSSVLWAQDGAYQTGFDEGDWSWKKVRYYFKAGLTSATEAERQANFARTFRGLGHQMHLIQDAAVPAHTRNDAHAEDSVLNEPGNPTLFRMSLRGSQWR